MKRICFFCTLSFDLNLKDICNNIFYVMCVDQDRKIKENIVCEAVIKLYITVLIIIVFIK